ncbi:hypothetical protein GGR47_001253 [Sphingomonas aquatilis]|uniref:Uncharacterized protein n=1 Tax=Sphingomonas aquatilis TaxID=93063 RepID=A0AAW3TPE2_9SPHN|nr:hypothetical protein [Sphingomonas aquatilis]
MLRWGATAARIGVCARGGSRKWTKWTVRIRRKREVRDARRAAAGRRADGSWHGCSRWGACRTGRWGLAASSALWRATLPHPPRHPGLGPGSTRPRGGGKRLRPSPSPPSGPRNESGVTGLFWARFRPPQSSLRRRLGHGAVACALHPQVLPQASATCVEAAPATPSPRTWSGVHRAARGRQEAPAIPLAAEWTPERVRGDGSFLGLVPATTLGRPSAGWGLPVAYP